MVFFLFEIISNKIIYVSHENLLCPSIYIFGWNNVFVYMDLLKPFSTGSMQHKVNFKLSKTG